MALKDNVMLKMALSSVKAGVATLEGQVTANDEAGALTTTRSLADATAVVAFLIGRSGGTK